MHFGELQKTYRKWHGKFQMFFADTFWKLPLATYYTSRPNHSLGNISCFLLNILLFKVDPNFGTFASLFDPPLVAYFNTPHMSMYSSRFQPLKVFQNLFKPSGPAGRSLSKKEQVVLLNKTNKINNFNTVHFIIFNELNLGVIRFIKR